MLALHYSATVPEPSSLALILAGALALLLPNVIGAFRSLSRSLQKYSEKLDRVLAGELPALQRRAAHIGHQAARTDFLN